MPHFMQMAPRQKVVVACHEHRYGKDLRVFKDAASAKEWRQSIADEWWDAEMPERRKKPADPEEAADAYFETMSDRGDRGEWFTIETCDVED